MIEFEDFWKKESGWYSENESCDLAEYVLSKKTWNRAINAGRRTEEYILCSAIHFDDGKKYIHQPKNIENGFVITGRRHHNCYGSMFILNGMRDKMIKHIQGFLTDRDRFVDRTEAMEIAKKAGQVGVNEKGVLISEDLW